MSLAKAKERLTDPGYITGLGVHFFTASGLICSFIALIATYERDWTLVFSMLGIALVIDGLDGTIARYFNIERLGVDISGKIIDNCVDYSNYVLVPTLALYYSGMLTISWLDPSAARFLAMAVCVTILISSVFYFAKDYSKDSNNHFVGFPSCWNIVAFLLFILSVRPETAIIVTVVLCIAQFLPIHVIHPMRVKRFRLLNICLSIIFVLLVSVTLAYNMEIDRAVAWTLLALSGYFLVAGEIYRRWI